MNKISVQLMCDKEKFFLVFLLALTLFLTNACSSLEKKTEVNVLDEESVSKDINPTVAQETLPATTITLETIESSSREVIATPTLSSSAMLTESFTPTSTPVLDTSESVLPIENSTDILVIGDLLWHPDRANAQEIEIETSGQPWSPDGSSLVGWSQSKDSLMILNLITGEERDLGISVRSAYWSPDGNQLLYAKNTSSEESSSGFNETALYIFDLTTLEEQFVAGPFQSSQLIQIIGWSADSQKIAYIILEEPPSGDKSSPVLAVLEIDQGEAEHFSGPTPMSFISGAWSPVNNQLLILGSDLRDNILEAGLPYYSFEAMYLLNLDTNQLEPLKGPSVHTSDFPQYKITYLNPPSPTGW